MNNLKPKLLLSAFAVLVLWVSVPAANTHAQVTDPGESASNLHVLNFDGFDDYVVISDDSTLWLTDSITVEAWVKPDTLLNASTPYTQLVTKNDASSALNFNDSWNLYYKDGLVKFGFRVENDEANALVVAEFPLSLEAGMSYHFAGTYDLEVIRLFVNGTEVASTPESRKIQIGSSDIVFGADAGSPAFYFRGSIDEVRLWNIARTQNGIRSDLNDTLAGNKPGLIGYWPMDEGTGQIIEDLSGVNDGRLGSSDSADLSDPAWMTGGPPYLFSPFLQPPGILEAHVDSLFIFQLNTNSSPAPVFALVHAPAAMNIDTATGLISWIPDTSDVGQAAVTAAAFNTEGSDTVDFSIDVSQLVYSAPEFVSIPDQVIPANHSFELAVEATGFPAPVFSLGSSPVGMTIDSVTGLITWMPDSSTVGEYLVEAIAENFVGSDLADFTVTVFDTGFFALRFDGFDDFVVVADHPDLRPEDSLTVEVWIMPDTAMNALSPFTQFVTKNDASSAANFLDAWNLYYKDGKIKFGFRVENDSAQGLVVAEWPVNLEAGAFYHFAGTYDHQNITLFVNGIAVAGKDENRNIQQGTTELVIGADSGPRDFYFRGVMDEIRIWTTARSQHEIQYTMNRHLDGTEYGLAAYWRFDDGPGQITADLTGNHPGQLGSTPGVDNADPTWVVSGFPHVSQPQIPPLPDLAAVVGTLFTESIPAAGNPIPQFQLLAAPSGMTIDGNSGKIQWTPDSSDLGAHTVDVLQTNPLGSDTASFLITVDFATTIDDGRAQLPAAFGLHQNFPNPFNPNTYIRFDLPQQSRVHLIVYNLLGQKVRTLVNGVQDAGFREILWDGKNDAGVSVSSGVYLYRITSERFVKTRKMMLLK